MFPSGAMASPNTMFQLAVGGATPGVIDFHRTALKAARVQNQQSLPVSQAPPNHSSAIKTENTFDSEHDHDTDAASGLFMLAQGNRTAGQPQSQYPLPPQPAIHGHPAPAVQHPDTQYNGNAQRISNVRGGSDAGSDNSEDSQNNRPNTRGRVRRAPGAPASATNGRRKAEEGPAKAPANKKAKLSIGAPSTNGSDHEDDDEDGMDEDNGGKPKHKMTEEEKRKNFLERNR